MNKPIKNKLIAIGELLIDFMPMEKNKSLKQVQSFTKSAGGAPANVAACVARLGGRSLMLTKVGADPFGEYLIDVLDSVKVDTQSIKKTSKAKTGLAFVSLNAEGERDFSFYRNPSADMLLAAEDIDETIFTAGDILHFCSVDLVDWPVREAHERAIEFANKHHMTISFDVNVRSSLWDDMSEYKETIQKFISKAHVIKLSDDELLFVTGHSDTKTAVSTLFRDQVKTVIITRGSEGADIFTQHMHVYVPSQPIQVVDTTGAGDAFIGALLFQMLKDDLDPTEIANPSRIEFAHRVSAYVVSHKGAIPAMPNMDEINNFISHKP